MESAEITNTNVNFQHVELIFFKKSIQRCCFASTFMDILFMRKLFYFSFVVICFCIARLWPGIIVLGRPVSWCHPKKNIISIQKREMSLDVAKMHSKSTFIPIKHWNKLEKQADSGVPHTARALYRPRYNGLVFFILLFFYIPSMYRGYSSPLLLLLLLLLL